MNSIQEQKGIALEGNEDDGFDVSMIGPPGGRASAGSDKPYVADGTEATNVRFIAAKSNNPTYRELISMGPTKSRSVTFDPKEAEEEMRMVAEYEAKKKGLAPPTQKEDAGAANGASMNDILKRLELLTKEVEEMRSKAPNQAERSECKDVDCRYSEVDCPNNAVDCQCVNAGIKDNGHVRIFAINLRSQNPEGDHIKINALMVIRDLIKMSFPTAVTEMNDAMLLLIFPDHEGSLSQANDSSLKYCDPLGTLGEDQAHRRAEQIATRMASGSMGSEVVRFYLQMFYMTYMEVRYRWRPGEG